MWNSAYALGQETLSTCSYHDSYVVSNQANDAGAVKTYPNVHKDNADVPLSSFSTMTSTFAATSPHVGIYNVAYDIWANGVATDGSTEIMIWTENFNQVSAGSRAATASLGGRSYDVWTTSNNGYIAFVPSVPLTSGTLDLLEIFDFTLAQGWLPAESTLGQICFGVEIVACPCQKLIRAGITLRLERIGGEARRPREARPVLPNNSKSQPNWPSIAPGRHVSETG